MSFEPRTFEQIVQSLRERSAPALTDFAVGGVARTMYESFAYELALLYEKMHRVYLSAFVDTAEGQQLDLVVAVLGISRGQPDFASGLVTFERDPGPEPVTIPIGSLVATEDREGAPRVVYQTTEERTLEPSQARVDAPIQARDRGDREVVQASALSVMLRPIPGVKAVRNAEATRFTGKGREGDDELRARAKSALMASGKATLISLEDAMLSQPGVRDVRVRESFRRARGDLLVEAPAGGRLELRRGDRAAPRGGAVIFTVTETVAVEGRALKVTVEAQAEGRAGEVPAGAEWDFLEPRLAGLAATNERMVGLQDFGMVEVFVDGVDLENARARERLRREIDRVRAAGVYVLLQQATAVEVDLVALVDPAAGRRGAELVALEEQATRAAADYVRGLRMGQPIFIAQLSKALLEVPGVDNLAALTLRARRRRGAALEEIVSLDTRRDPTGKIEPDETARFVPVNIAVAAGTKALPVQVRLQADGLDAAVRDRVVAALSAHFNGLEVNQPVSGASVRAAAAAAGASVARLELVPRPGFPGLAVREDPAAQGERIVETRLVERAQLAEVFAYSAVLEVVGALRLEHAPGASSAERARADADARAAAAGYLDGLPPEAPVELSELARLASAAAGGIQIGYAARDFQTLLGGRAEPGRLDRDRIVVNAFEKAAAARTAEGRPLLLVTSEVTSVRVTIAQLVVGVEQTVTVYRDKAGALRRAGTGDLFDEAAEVAAIRAELVAALKRAASNLIASPRPGDDVGYRRVRGALLGLTPAFAYTLDSLLLRAESDGDGRRQESPVSIGGQPVELDIHVRSVEVARVEPLADDAVQATIAIRAIEVPAPPDPDRPSDAG